MAAMASPENYYMQLGCVDGVLKQSLLKFDFLKCQLQMQLQLLRLYPELKSTLAHFCNLVAKMYLFAQEIYHFFFKFVCLMTWIVKLWSMFLYVWQIFSFNIVMRSTLPPVIIFVVI